MLENVTVKWTDDSQYQHMCLMQTNNFYKYKPHSSFSKIFWQWLVMEFQNPAPEAGILLKTAQILDRSKHACAGALLRRLQETTAKQQQQPLASTVGGNRRGGGRVQQRQVGIPAHRASLDTPHGRYPRSCSRAAPEWGPAQMKTRFWARVLALPRKSFDFSYESPNISLQM